MKKFFSRENLVLTLFAGLGVATVAAYLWSAREWRPDVEPADRRDLYEFQLDTSRGNSIGEELGGHWSLVIVGYMTCPDVCPTSLAYVAREYERWGEKLGDLKIAFLSADPDRDKMAGLTAYVSHFHPDFIALRAEEPELKKFVSKLGGYYSREESDSAAGYLVSHSAGFFLVNPRGKLVSTFTEPQVQGRLAQELGKYMKGVL